CIRKGCSCAAAALAVRCSVWNCARFLLDHCCFQRATTEEGSVARAPGSTRKTNLENATNSMKARRQRPAKRTGRRFWPERTQVARTNPSGPNEPKRSEGIQTARTNPRVVLAERS